MITSLAAIVIVAPAFAGDVEKAEHRRLSEEMGRLASRNAWSGVEAKFQALLELQKKGEVLTFDEWYLGAQAAQNLGDITACRDRLAQAVAVNPKEEAVAWLAQIDAVYGPVDVKSLDRESDSTLTIAMMPFAADQRAAVEKAQKLVAETGAYKGLLPAGDYTFSSSGVDRTFTVTAGGQVVAVEIKPAEGTQGTIAYVGPRLDLGGVYTLGADPGAESGPQPPGFAGAGARAGLGLEVGFRRGFGVMAEVGYHSLFASNGLEAREGVPNLSNRINLGYVAVGPTFRIGDNIWLGAAGVGAAGTARVTGIAGLDTINQQCPFGAESADCSWVSSIEEEDRAYYPWSGSMKVSGAQASVGFAFLDIGTSLRGGVTLAGGTMFDDSRSYNWGQVGFTVAPVPKKAKE